MIKCVIDGVQRDLEEKPVYSANGWYQYRTADHFTVISLPTPPKELVSMRAKITISGSILEIGKSL